VVECDTGRKSAGVETPAEDVNWRARSRASRDELKFDGFCVSDEDGCWVEAKQKFSTEALTAVRAHMASMTMVSGPAARPNMKNSRKIKGATEPPAGRTYLYNGPHAGRGGVPAGWTDCALTSSPPWSAAPPGQRHLDAGLQALTSDTAAGWKAHGLSWSSPGAKIARLHEEKVPSTSRAANTRHKVGADVSESCPTTFCVVRQHDGRRVVVAGARRRDFGHAAVRARGEVAVRVFRVHL